MNDILKIEFLYKSFDKGKNFVLSNINLTLNKGEILTLLGESGSGKTTLGRLIAGLDIPDSGSIFINGEIMSSSSKFVAPELRKVGMVFQDYALFPHLNVFKNIAYGLSSNTDKVSKVYELLELVGLENLEKRFPHQLSGGQQQRVALARTLATNPNIIILDEPFSNLDAHLKVQLRDEVFQILKEKGITSIFITHDYNDAKEVADRVLKFDQGKLFHHS